MKHLSKFLLLALTLYGANAYAASPVATTAGSNLTAFNGNSGATNNNMWNAYINPRANMVSSAPTADFGNCNAVILRCAQPKCANGGCSTMDVARPIVIGCVQSNPSCNQYGDDLIDYISAQLVSDANAAAQAAAANAQIAAANASAQQSAQQMQQMQQQMAQMQQQMQQQSADTAAQIQAALAQQQQATAQAIADAASANVAALNSVSSQIQTATATTTSAPATNTAASTSGSSLTAAQQSAALAGISADLLAREQISGQILTKVENAENALKRAQAAMNTAFEYAGCDSTGSNCTGPKRVSVFKDKAMEFFDPYNDVLDELYDGLILAQSVGVDITDIYMMLNGTCNAWGQYLCAEGQVMHYTSKNCQNGKSVPVESGGGTVFGGADCEPGQVVPMSDGGCQLIKMLTSDEEIQRNWLYPEMGTGGVQVRVGCASEALDNSFLFRNRKKQADIDIETLQRIIEQDAPTYYGSNIWSNSQTTPKNDGIIYCAVGAETYNDLRTLAGLRELPDRVCVDKQEMADIATSGVPISSTIGESTYGAQERCRHVQGTEYMKCLCTDSTSDRFADWDDVAGECECLNGDDLSFDYNKLQCVKDSENTARSPSNRTNVSGFRYSFSYPECWQTGGTVDPVTGICKCGDNAYLPSISKCANGKLESNLSIQI